VGDIIMKDFFMPVNKMVMNVGGYHGPAKSGTWPRSSAVSVFLATQKGREASRPYATRKKTDVSTTAYLYALRLSCLPAYRQDRL